MKLANDSPSVQRLTCDVATTMKIMMQRNPKFPVVVLVLAIASGGCDWQKQQRHVATAFHSPVPKVTKTRSSYNNNDNSWMKTTSASSTSTRLAASPPPPSKSPLDAFKDLFTPKFPSPQQASSLSSSVKEVTPPPPPPLPDVVIDPDFRLAGIFSGLAVILDSIPYIQFFLGIPVTLLGLLFLIQTFRIRFVFDQDSFSVKTSLVDQNTGELQGSGENVVVGGENRWSYKSFVNYDFFPKGWIDQPQGPILVYFKENETPPDTWYQGPGKYANSEEALANGAEPGQVHFFPSIGNPQQIREQFEKRGCNQL